MCCISRHIWIDKKTKLRFKFAGSLQAEGNSIRRVTLDEIESFIIGNAGKSLDDVVNNILKLHPELTRMEINEIINNLKENGIIENKKTNEAMRERISQFSKHSLPNTAILMLCQECNLRCKYCYADGGEYQNPGIMSEEIGRKAIDFIANLDKEGKQFNINLFGGEPLMNFTKVKDLVAYAKKVAKEINKSVSFSITTNGTLVNEEIEDFLMTERFNVTLSIDGGELINDRNRFFADGKGAYSRTVNNTKNIREKGIVGIRGTITGSDVDLLGRWKDLRTLGAKNINFSPSVNMMEDSDYDKLTESYKEAIDLYCKKIRTGEYDYIKNMGFISKFFEKIGNGGLRVKNCGAGNNMLAVDKDGNLYPCHRLVSQEKYRVGDVRRGLDKERWAKLEREMLIDNYKKCKDCWLSSFCCGGCIQENMIMEGEPNIPYYNNCKYMKIITEYAVTEYLKLVKEGFLNGRI